ncbi:MAG: sigma-70 family RNA polymerase sigma factor [Chthonomonadales bacterium]
MRDDLRLAREIDQGDRRAFERFLDAYGGRVHALVRRAIPNPSDAEDVTQEIFVDLFKCMGKFRGDSALSTWVYRIAMNHCLKHRSRMKPDSLELDESMEQESDWRSNPLLSATKNELKGQVSQALEQLTPLHRDVIVLHELHGLTYQECAEILDIPVGTVKSRLSNAFTRLRLLLGNYVLGQDGPSLPEAIGETYR